MVYAKLNRQVSIKKPPALSSYHRRKRKQLGSNSNVIITTSTHDNHEQRRHCCLYRQLSDDTQWIVREILLLVTLNRRQSQVQNLWQIRMFCFVKFLWRHPIIMALNDVREICFGTLLYEYRRKILQHRSGVSGFARFHQNGDQMQFCLTVLVMSHWH